jgi:hypothetical protein
MPAGARTTSPAVWRAFRLGGGLVRVQATNATSASGRGSRGRHGRGHVHLSLRHCAVRKCHIWRSHYCSGLPNGVQGATLKRGRATRHRSVAATEDKLYVHQGGFRRRGFSSGKARPYCGPVPPLNDPRPRTGRQLAPGGEFCKPDRWDGRDAGRQSARSMEAVVKTHISVDSVADLEEEAAYTIVIYEEAPDGANADDDADPHLGEDGTLVVETDRLEVESDFPLADFPRELSLPVSFMGWDETEDRMADAHGLQVHPPAEVTITLVKKWQSKSGRSIALYSVEAVHGM